MHIYEHVVREQRALLLACMAIGSDSSKQIPTSAAPMVYFAVQGCSSDALSKTKTDYDSFLADPANLKAVKEQLQVSQLS